MIRSFIEYLSTASTVNTTSQCDDIRLYLLLSVFSSSKLWRILWARSSCDVGVCVMSSGAAAASRDSTKLWNSLCLMERLVGVAQAAALTLRMEGGEERNCNDVLITKNSCQ